MPAWRNSAQWRPPQFGILHPTELVPFLVWLMPAGLGILLMILEKASTGSFPSAPERLDQLGLFGGHLPSTLLWSPLWGFPAVLAMAASRLVLLNMGWFGWASALAAGALSGLAVPVMLGQTFWVIGPLYGAAALWMQQAIYRSQDPASFDA
jgi:hypothetical protein